MYINKNYSKLLADYYIFKGNIMTSEFPKEYYIKTVETLEQLLVVIKPEFFMSVSDFEHTYAQFIDELNNLKANSKLMDYVS